MSKLIHGAHHIALKCQSEANFQETIHFYGDVLGLDVARTWGSGDDAGIMFHLGDGTLLEIFASGGAAHGGAIPHYALATTDTDACAAAVPAANADAPVTLVAKAPPAASAFAPLNTLGARVA